MCSHAMQSHKHVPDTAALLHPSLQQPTSTHLLQQKINFRARSWTVDKVGAGAEVVEVVWQDRVVLSCNDPGIVTSTIQISTACIVTIFGDLCSVLTLSAVC